MLWCGEGLITCVAACHHRGRLSHVFFFVRVVYFEVWLVERCVVERSRAAGVALAFVCQQDTIGEKSSTAGRLTSCCGRPHLPNIDRKISCAATGTSYMTNMHDA